MKKIISVIMAITMFISCFAISTGAMAADLPELKVGKSVSIVAPKSQTEEMKVAKFVPTKTACYVFECTTAYKNTSAEKDSAPGGAFGINEDSEGEPTQGFTFFFDLSSLSQEYIDAYKELGMDTERCSIPKFTASLVANKTYYIVIYQDGTQDYATELTVAEHTHTLKRGQEEKVKVNKNGTSDDLGGIYDTCEDWFCAYLDYTTVYKQLESTKVKNAVYTGKKVKPAVVIRTTDGKKLNKKYYTVKYKNNKKIGKGTVVITFKNGYVGTVKKTFKINPKKTSLTSATASAKQVKASYKKGSNITGYQVMAATNKKFTKNKKTATVKGANKTSASVKGLKSGKTYYVRVRTYKVVKGKKYYSAWSKAKAVKVK